MGGGGSGGGGPTESWVYNTNIPEYAQPFVETMLGTAQQQVYNYDESGSPTSMKGYTPFSANPADYVAGFSPMQQQSFYGAANLGTAPELGVASDLASAAGMAGIGTQYNPMAARTQNFGGRQAAQYMNPYLEASLAPQMELLNRQYGQQAAQNAGQATQAGAFGGSRFGIQQAQNQLNQNLATQNLLGQGYNQAFQQAQQQFNADQARRLQAQQQTEQSRQFGANLGLQGLQAGLQAAGTLGQLGQTAYGQQVGNINLQNQLGQQQQAQQQQILNQQVQDYATAQQYPMMQLANMSNLLRGLPMQSTTVQSYQAAPSTLSQIAGLGTAAAGAYKAFGAKGGKPEDFEKKKDKAPAGLAELALMKMA